LSDVGLVLLAKPVKSVKPVQLPQPGALERGRGGTEDQALVGYLYPEGIRRYRITSPATIFDDRWVQGGAGEACGAVVPALPRAASNISAPLAIPEENAGRPLERLRDLAAGTVPKEEAGWPGWRTQTFCRGSINR
jgi:hypothetical protein